MGTLVLKGLKGINTYRNIKKLGKHYSVTEFLRSDPKNDIDIFPEYSDTRKINYYPFEINAESYTKTVETTTYSRTTRVVKKEKIYGIVEKLLAKNESYLQRRSHVGNIAEVFPMIRERFTGSSRCSLFW